MAKRLKSGHILRIPLLHNLGYAYAKYVNVAGINGNNSYADMIKIFDCRSEPTSTVDFANLHTYLMQPLLLAGRIPMLQLQSWQIIESLPVDKEDLELPDMLISKHLIDDRMNGFPQPKPGASLYTKNLAIRPAFETAKQNVDHLEYIGALGTGFIEVAATMCFMLQEGIEIQKKIDLNDTINRYIYEIYSSRPLANTLPKYLYGKARQANDPDYIHLS